MNRKSAIIISVVLAILFLAVGLTNVACIVIAPF